MSNLPRIFSTLISGATGLAMLIASPSGLAGFRIQHFTPELRWMAQPAPEQAKLEAAIVAPRGLSCYLPSQDGYCTIPLMWLTEQDNPASLWRELNANRIKLATGYDGQVNATVRLNQVPKYEVVQGVDNGGKVLDSAVLTAIWDPAAAADLAKQKQAELTLENNGDCQILTDQNFCEVELSWTAKNVSTASLWQRTNSGLVSVYEGAIEAALKVAAYETASVYELREGRNSDGQLLSAAMTKGHRVQAVGEISLPDGTSCALATGQASCDVRVAWESNDTGRLWLREKAMSKTQAKGQALVSISANGGIVDLRAGSQPSGSILDRATLTTVAVDNAGRITTLNGVVCEIPYSGESCEQDIYFEIEKGEGSIWSESGQLLKTGSAGELKVTSSEYGEAYYLRAGTDKANPILTTYLAKGIKQTYRGSLKPVSLDTCTFDVQGGSCRVPVEYEASDKASIWDVSKAVVVAGGNKSGTVDLIIHDESGSTETMAAFDLKIHGGYSPKLGDPVLGSVLLKGVQPNHSGQLSTPAGTSCNLLYSKNTCQIELKVITTAPTVTLWDDQAGTAVRYDNSGTQSFMLDVVQGSKTYTLREGRKITNKAFGSVTLSAVRPNYYAQITFPSGSNCTTVESNGSCAISLKLNSNTATRVQARDITVNPNANWTVIANGLPANASVVYTGTGITGNRALEFKVEQYVSPYEVLDIANGTITINAPHSFALTSTLPQPGNGKQCRAHWTTQPDLSQCQNSTPITWTTSANTVTACRGLKSVGTYAMCSAVSGKAFHYGNNWSIANREYLLDFYEGTVNVSSQSDASSKGYRLLSSNTYWPARVMDPTEHSITTNSDAYTCELADRDVTSCYASIVLNHTLPYDPVHQNISGQSFNLNYYLAQKGSAVAASGPFANTSPLGVSLIGVPGAEPTIYELRLRDGNSSLSATDPVVKSITVGTKYRDVTGFVQAKRVADSSYASQSFFSNGAMYPYYFARTYSEGVYSPSAEPCNIQAHENNCTMYLHAEVSNSSRASVFVDGVYVATFNQYLYWYQNSKFVLKLPVGEHDIAIHDGTTPAAINNKKIDGFSISVRRPTYSAGMTPRANNIELSYYGEKQGVAVDFTSNTAAYVFNKATNEQIYATQIPYGADERFRFNSAFTATLGEGSHVLEMRTHQNASDPNNLVLSTITINLAHKVQTMAVRASASYPQFYNQCREGYLTKYCRIYFDYVNAHTSTGGISLCAVSGSSIRFLKNINGVTSYSSQVVDIKMSETEVRAYNGKNCPSSTANTEGLPLLITHAVNVEPYQVGAAIDVIKNGSYELSKSVEESDTWLCDLKYQGGSCSFGLTISPNPMSQEGQNTNAYYGVWRNPSAFLVAPLHTGNAYSVYDAVNDGAANTYSAYACAGNTHYSGCPIASSVLVNQVKVKARLPDFVGSIQAPGGVSCMAVFGGTSCTLSIRFTTSSGYVTLLRDGVSIEAGNNPDLTKNYSLPAKAKGVPTVLTLVDGSSVNNRVLATLNVYPELYDQGIFKFTNPQKNKNLKEPCVFNLLEPSNDCEIHIGYESDGSVKYLSSSSSISESTVSGNGSMTYRKTYVPSVGRFPAFAGTDANSLTDDYISAYTDSARTQSAGTLKIDNKFALYSDNIFSSPVGANYTLRTDPSGSVSCNSSCYFWINNWGNSFQTSGGINIDGMVLTEPALCNKSSYTQGCGAVDYMTVHKNIATSAQGSISMTTGANYRVTRIFYRAEAVDLTDPVVSIGGVVRPIVADGVWHYLDVDITTPTAVVFSAINDNPSAKTLKIDVWAKYHVIDVAP